jgi:alginate O-acetyltransferase complex protein AlgI
VHLPIGISFFTFEAIAYLVDVRRGLTPAQRDPIKFGLFMTLFPHLIAGPVVRYRDLADALERCEVKFDQFASGIRRFIVGLAKKVLLANALARTADLIFAQRPELLDASAAWLGVVCYALQIYFDFSGYSDMAIGLGRLFGFELVENFRYPYTADSVTDFWRRWHISLSNWFRDFVYIPLGGNRRGVLGTTFNLMTVFVLCGLWHGASWNFLVWGLWHGGFLVLERFVRNVPLNRYVAIALWLPRHAYTLAVVLLSWVFFRAENLTHASEFLATMFGDRVGAHSWADYWNREIAVALCVGGIGAMPLVPLLRSWRARFGGSTIFEIFELLILLALLAACIVAMAGGTFDPFIYFRF